MAQNGFDGLERISTQTLLDVLEVPQILVLRWEDVGPRCVSLRWGRGM